MSQTYAQLKAAVRAIIFPSGEASSLVAAHNKAFVDALIDLQTFDECLQSDNVSIFPQCSTLYNCGITVFDAPRGRIKRIVVIDSRPAPAPSGSILFTGSFSPAITDAATSPASIGVVAGANLYVIETIGLGSACKTKEVPQYFNVTVNYNKSDGTFGTISRRVTLNDCSTSQLDQINAAANSPVYVSIMPVNVPVKNVPGTGNAQITVNVRNYVASDTSTPTDDYCSEIEYRQIEPAYVQKYWNRARQGRRCPSIPFFFGLNPESCGMGHYPPVPTDASVPAGLAILPLGYHYPQADTDKKHRAQVGLWAIERAKIYIAPWINSTETVIVTWDGIKRAWADADPVDDDPLLVEAVTAFVRRDHFTYWERDYQAAEAANAAYVEARQKLIHECREENRIRPANDPSYARATSSSNTLFYNGEQSATANCQPGQVGNPVTITISAGTIGSSVSQADADAQALKQAQQQAQQQLTCSAPPITYYNTPQSYTATCQPTTGEPSPSGNPVTVNIPAGQITSTISQADADSKALALATSEATAQLACIFHNAAQTYTAVCPNQATASVPTMTSNTTPSGVVSASSTQTVGSEYKGFLAALQTSGGWYATGALPQWLQYQFAASQFVTSYSLTRAPLTGFINGDPLQGASPCPSAWKFQGSADGATWTTLDAQSGITLGDASVHTFTIAVPGSYQYYRILISSTLVVPAGVITCALADLQLYTSQYATVTNPVNTFTSQISQSDADAQALNAAKVAANAALVCSGGGGGGGVTVYLNTVLSVNKIASCQNLQGAPCNITATIIIAAGTFSSIVSQADANQQALNYGNQRIQWVWQGACLSKQCQGVTVNYP